MENNKIKVFTMFSGVEGGTLLLDENKYEIVGVSEFEEKASSILRYKYPDVPNFRDVTKIDTSTLPNFDILISSFPCQAFSIAGDRKGFEDTRGTLVFDTLRVVKDKKPKYVLLENVKGLTNHDKGNTLITILKSLSDLNYVLDFEVLNSKHFGINQPRERVFILAINKDYIDEAKINIYRQTKENNTRESSGDQSCSAPDASNKFQEYLADKQSFGKECFSEIIPKEKSSGRDSKIEFKDKSDQETAENEDMELFAYSKSTRSAHIDERIRKDGTVNTLNCGDGCRTQSSASFVYDKKGVRKLSPLECERFMGWPDNHTKFGINDKGEKFELSASDRYARIGNGITSICVKEILDRFFK